MRLLHVRDFSFEEHQKNPEPYAILSHRWTKSETTLANIKRDGLKLSLTSGKVFQFAQYVKSQFSNLNWIWVDSCCINQDSAVELSEGVNCMFDWYRDAAVCIAYLQDVKHPSDWVTFRKSVWFERGWTLQELLASTVVVFLTAQWEVIGHKGNAAHLKGKIEIGPNIESLLAERTRIPLTVLQDFSTSHSMSIEERLRWMHGRETLKEEDMIYAMFGIFGVTPGANYGEKRYSAEQRLREAIDRKQRLKAGHIYNEEPNEDEIAAEIEKWLSAPDPSTNHASACERHQPETCQWLLQHERYERWKSGEIKHLWLHGKPGCGKSVLCSTVIEDLQVYYLDHPDTGFAYFYFTFSDDHKQGYDDLILSLVAQFARREPARSVLRLLHDKYKQSRPGTQELERALVAIVASFDGAFLVLDALDESPDLGAKRRDLLKRLQKLTSQIAKLRLFATSRYLPDIRALADDLGCEQISLQPCDVSGDIQHYVVAQLSTEPRLRDFTQEVKDMIEKNVTDNADGMFRWAFLLLDQLSKLKNSKRSKIEAALRTFPKDLDNIYARILQDIGDEEQRDAFTLLRWITYAREPLSLEELVHALTIEPEHDAVNFDDHCAPGDILRILTSLVVVIEERDTNAGGVPGILINGSTKIRLAHFTVQEYLEATRIQQSDAKHMHIESRTGHHFLTQCCLMYILHYSSSDEKESTRNDLVQFPLLHYAAKSWCHHASLHEHVNVDFELKLLQSNAASNDWLIVHDPDNFWGEPFWGQRYGLRTSIYHASHAGLKLVVQRLLEEDTNVNVEGGRWGSALQAASVGGHIEVVKLLLGKDANVNAEGGHYGSALQAASEGGHIEVVKLLLEKNANVNAEGGEYGSALRAASARGHIEVVKLLVEKGANVNVEGGVYGSALYAASAGGHIAVVKLLLEKDANVNAWGGRHGSALQAASVDGHVEVVKLLLEKDANVNAWGGRHGSALQAASHGGHIEVVKLLLEKNANVNAEGGYYGSALQVASTEGHIEVVKLLLEKDANVNAWGDAHGSALQAASHGGHIEVVKLLLEKDANVNVGGDVHGSALQVASHGGHIEVVKLLLEKNADVNAEGGYYGSALQAASHGGYVEAVKLLLEKNVVVNAEGGELGSALQAASHGGHIEVVKLLLENDANVKAEGGYYGSALQAASRGGHIEVVKLLLEHSAKVNAKGGKYESALQAASGKGHVEVVKLLLEKSANVNVEGGRHGSALQAASVDGHVEVVKLLLEKNANINAEGGEHGSALQAASQGGHIEVVKLLLEKDANANAEGGRHTSALQAV